MRNKRMTQDDDEVGPILSVSDVTRILHVSRSLLYELVQRGDLPALRIGRRVLFRARDVEAFLVRHGTPLPGRPHRKR